MNMRKITSLVTFGSFVGTILTSVILYVTPQGRVAYWSNWRLWGLGKDAWGGLHINLGVLFLLAATWHGYLNWRPLLAYLKDRSAAAGRVAVSAEALGAVALCLATVAGTLLAIPPFSSVLTLNEAIKEYYAVTLGEPPFGHAELSSIRGLAEKTGLEGIMALRRLAEAGISAEPESVVADVAIASGRSPEEIFRIMQGKQQSVVRGQLPETPPAGVGRKTVEELCTEYGLDVEAISSALNARGITPKMDVSLKELASENGISSFDLYDILRGTQPR